MLLVLALKACDTSPFTQLHC